MTRLHRWATAIWLAAMMGGALVNPAFAADRVVYFDKVKVSAAKGAGVDDGFTLYSVQALDDGPYKTRNGGDSITFLRTKPGKPPEFLNSFTGASLTANALDWRYFGSVATDTSKGSILINNTGLLLGPDPDDPNGFNFDRKAVAAKDITGFEVKLIKLLKPGEEKDKIVKADGGKAFKGKIADDKQSASFTDGLVKAIPLPALDKSGEFLWSYITGSPQPKQPRGLFEDGSKPLKPDGEYTNVVYAGRALTAAVPEPGSWMLGLAGGLLVLGWRKRPAQS